MDALIEILLQAGAVAALACAVGLFRPKSFRLRWLAVALLLMVFH